MTMKGIAKRWVTNSLGVALLVVSTTGVACSRTPLGDATGSAPASGAGRADALNPMRAEVDVAPDLPRDLAPDGKPPALAFVSVSAGESFACGVRSDGTIACWGDSATAPPAP